MYWEITSKTPFLGWRRGGKGAGWEWEVMDIPLMFAVFFLAGFNTDFILPVLFV